MRSNDLIPTAEPIGNRSSRPWRGVIVGCVGVVVIGLAAPFNDWVMLNTPLVGSVLSLAVMIAMLMLVLVVNAGVARLFPSLRLGQRDLSAALVLLLVGCSFASVGLVRYLPGFLAMIWEHASSNPTYAALFGRLDLPDWLFPVDGPIAERGQSDVIRHFYARTPDGGQGFLSSIADVPWRAWAGPILAWGLLIALMMVSLVSALAIFLPQWSQVERLPFPIAKVYGSLIESPDQGQAFNSTLASKRFWIALSAVLLLHVVNGLSRYTSGAVPHIPTSFDLAPVLSDAPWSYTELLFRQQSIYFSIIGMMFFVQNNRVLSLWLAMILLQIVRMFLGGMQLDLTPAMVGDQQNGAILGMALITLLLARRHLWSVIRASCGLRADGSVSPWAGRLLLLGVVGQVMWMHLAGMSLPGAFVIVVLLLLLYVTLARTLAETGIPYLLLPLDFRRFMLYAAHDLPVLWKPSVRDGFWSGAAHAIFTHDTRESASNFISTALRCDATHRPAESRTRVTGRLVALVALGLILGYFASWIGYLAADYRYAVTLDSEARSPINEWGAYGISREIALEFSTNQLDKPADRHSRPVHFATGFGGVIATMIFSVRFGWWPLHPVGLLLVHTWGLKSIWFSIFLGWLIKIVVLRLGGSRLLQASQPLFLGLIIGEACAAAFWLVVAAYRFNGGMEYFRIQLLPT